MEQVNLGQLCKIYKKLKVKDQDTKWTESKVMDQCRGLDSVRIHSPIKTLFEFQTEPSEPERMDVVDMASDVSILM